MASQNKKRKAKNSYLSNGGEKLDGKKQANNVLHEETEKKVGKNGKLIRI